MPPGNPEGRAAQILQAWTMAAQKPVRGLELRASVIEGADRPASACVLASGQRGILIPLQSGERVGIPRAFRADSPGALRAEIAQFSTGERAENAVHVWCIDGQCDEAFLFFSAFLVERLGPMDLSQLLGDAHREFQRLVGVGAAASKSRITGLVGELLVLRDAIAVDKAAIRYWAGPRGERHDFRRSNMAIEVKATRRSEAKTRRVRISDWDQLEVPEQGRLYLHAVRLEQCAGGEASIPHLIGSIHAILDGQGCAAFDELLGAFEGELLRAPDEFAILSRSTYSVQPGFPRLVPSAISAGFQLHGVTAVSYDLDLEQAEEFRYEWSSALADLIGQGIDHA